MVEELSSSVKLDKYEELELKIKNNQDAVNEKRLILDEEKNKLLASILTPEQKEKMDEINAEFENQYEVLNNNLELKQNKETLELMKKEIQEDTLKAKVTIKGSVNPKKMCVYTPEKVKTNFIVDEGLLKGMTINIPKLKNCWHEETETTPARVAIR
jgi:hypothetical protein